MSVVVLSTQIISEKGIESSEGGRLFPGGVTQMPFPDCMSYYTQLSSELVAWFLRQGEALWLIRVWWRLPALLYGGDILPLIIAARVGETGAEERSSWTSKSLLSLANRSSAFLFRSHASPNHANQIRPVTMNIMWGSGEEPRTRCNGASNNATHRFKAHHREDFIT
jgi:hypothetical protein